MAQYESDGYADNAMLVIKLDSRAHVDEMGLIPSFLDSSDPRLAQEQFHENYAHGGGFRPFEGFEVMPNFVIQYPGDSALHPLFMLRFRDELIFIYPYGWVGIFQKDKSHVFARMD